MSIAGFKPDEALRWFGNTMIAIRLSASAGADGICVVEHWMPFGDSPPLHVHHTEDEVFHILEGEMRFRVAEGDVVARAGDTVLAPKGLPHSYRVESRSGARSLTITRGADFETMLREASRPAAAAELPAPAQPTPEMIEALVAACARNHIEIVGPPLS
jgi:mannose-6-phosphate isomerase-like protein (cupin superfamily)